MRRNVLLSNNNTLIDKFIDNSTMRTGGYDYGKLSAGFKKHNPDQFI